MCFILDTVAAASMLGLYATNKGGPRTLGSAASVFFHGVFHYSQYLCVRSATCPMLASPFRQ
jgi:hypothetical protein